MLSTSGAHTTNQKWNQDKTLVEITGATTIQFDFEQTWRTLSSLLLSDQIGSHCGGEIDNPENTAAITYRLNYAMSSGETATLIVYNVLRKYIEADRVVFVWRVLIEGQGEIEGLFSDEHSWLVLRPSLAEDTPECPATIFEGFSRFKTVVLNGELFSDESRQHRFVSLLVKAEEEDIKQAMQQILSMSPETMVVK